MVSYQIITDFSHFKLKKSNPSNDNSQNYCLQDLMDIRDIYGGIPPKSLTILLPCQCFNRYMIGIKQKSLEFEEEIFQQNFEIFQEFENWFEQFYGRSRIKYDRSFISLSL